MRLPKILVLIIWPPQAVRRAAYKAGSVDNITVREEPIDDRKSFVQVEPTARKKECKLIHPGGRARAARSASPPPPPPTRMRDILASATICPIWDLWGTTLSTRWYERR